ncbi:hypothetical protein P7K49_031559, partial [Saguinus oedipus]
MSARGVGAATVRLRDTGVKRLPTPPPVPSTVPRSPRSPRARQAAPNAALQAVRSALAVRSQRKSAQGLGSAGLGAACKFPQDLESPIAHQGASKAERCLTQQGVLTAQGPAS